MGPFGCNGKKQKKQTGVRVEIWFFGVRLLLKLTSSYFLLIATYKRGIHIIHIFFFLLFLHKNVLWVQYSFF